MERLSWSERYHERARFLSILSILSLVVHATDLTPRFSSSRVEPRDRTPETGRTLPGSHDASANLAAPTGPG
jgi:hypothetical protein